MAGLAALLLAFTWLLGAGPASAASAKAVTAASGSYVMAFEAFNGGYIDNAGDSPNLGNRIILWSDSGSPHVNDWWWVVPTGSPETYTIHNNHYNGMCLDVPNSNFKAGVYLQLWSCNGSDAQTFKIHNIDDLHYVIAADWNGNTLTLCLDVHTNRNNEGVWLWQCNYTGQQEWF